MDWFLKMQKRPSRGLHFTMHGFHQNFRKLRMQFQTLVLMLALEQLLNCNLFVCGSLVSKIFGGLCIKDSKKILFLFTLNQNGRILAESVHKGQFAMVALTTLKAYCCVERSGYSSKRVRENGV